MNFYVVPVSNRPVMDGLDHLIKIFTSHLARSIEIQACQESNEDRSYIENFRAEFYLKVELTNWEGKIVHVHDLIRQNRG